MVSIEQLQQAKPRQWEEAADTWDICARAWPSLDRDYQDLVVQRLHHWSGPAAMAAKLLVNSVQQGFRGDDGQDLADWMRKTAEILRGFAAKLAEAQTDLGAALQEEPGAGPDPGTASVYAVSTTEAALQKAAEADREAAQRLRALLHGQEWTDRYVLTPAEAADLMKRAAQGDAAALAELRQHRDQFSDPYFAKRLATTLGAEGMAELPSQMGRVLSAHLPTDSQTIAVVNRNRELLGMLSDTLAAAGDPNNPAWDSPQAYRDFVDDIKETGREMTGVPPAPGYWAIGQILDTADGNPPYADSFLTDVGEDMKSWVKQNESLETTFGPYQGAAADILNQPGSDPRIPGNGGDPLAGLMQAAGHSPEAAQALVTGPDGQEIDPYLYDREWADKADRFGLALEAAADPNSADPETAAHIASDVVDRIGTDLANDRAATDLRFDGMQDSLGRILGDRIGDVNSAVNDTHDYGDGVSPLDPEKARFSKRELAEAIRYAAGDDAGYHAMIDAETVHAKAEMTAWAKDENRTLTGAVSQAANTLGFIVSAREDVLLEEGRELDAQHDRVADLANRAVGMVTLPADLGPAGTRIAGFALDTAAGNAIDEYLRSSENVEQARSNVATIEDAQRQLLWDAAATALVNNPDESEGLKPWEHPDHEHFYDSERRTLKAPKELAANDGAGFEALEDYIKRTGTANDNLNNAILHFGKGAGTYGKRIELSPNDDR